MTVAQASLVVFGALGVVTVAGNMLAEHFAYKRLKKDIDSYIEDNSDEINSTIRQALVDGGF